MGELMKKILIVLILSIITLQANSVNIYEYQEQNKKYLVIEKASKEKEVVEDKVPFMYTEKEQKDISKLQMNVNKKSKNILIQENLYEIIKNDDISAFNNFITEKENISIINQELEIVKGFKYPFHQALINKSFNILIKMLSLSKISVELVEKSGTSTMDILKMYDFEDHRLGKEVIKKYILKTKG